MKERGWGVDISEGKRDGAHIAVVIALRRHALVQDIAMSAGGEGVPITLSSCCCCATSEGEEEGARYNERHSTSLHVKGGYARDEDEPEE